MSLSQPEQTVINDKKQIKYKKCKECNKKRKFFIVEYQICCYCYNLKTILKPKQSENKIIDNFIRYTQSNYVTITEGKMEFVSYDQFKNIEFIAQGGFSKVYKATWVDGPIINWDEIIRNGQKIIRDSNRTVVLKKLNNSKNITSKELNELQIFYQIYSKKKVDHEEISGYFGITQDPITKDIMIIMTYYNEGDLIGYLNNKFYNINWNKKLSNLIDIARGLKNIHDVNIIHRDFHSGNIFFSVSGGYIGDLGISKSATESTNDNENYGIISYMAPEIFRGQKYTKASDIYSFGMIMWEFMTGRRPFWDRNHDAYLIIDICDGLRPPIVTNAPDGYIDLMKECWHFDPEKRPRAADIKNKIENISVNEIESSQNNNSTKIVESLDIGPVSKNNPGAIYKSRPLSEMIHSAMSLMSSRSGSINLETVKRKFANLINNDNGQSIKRKKLRDNEFNDYLTNEIELDIDVGIDYNKLHKPHNKEYITKEFEFDIDINNS
ncbi:hypothetical protein RclHR1_03620001 [Rhizophagus clarus]|uniref:Kinase-like domain-containing protein n=1 Tax=Rhizophagus clarus TaxID=94130 RepID=A0A2Z6RFG8_9GLOM|nr:hypothetical protein RclHR1_03620001 [Rhizophagus clarus]GES96367.1 kinase-like domain-containing protein [Rhizophagus clarus]